MTIFLRKFISILIGSFFIAVGINFFLVPSELLDGGAIGIGLVSHYVTGVQVGLVIILINIPIFIFSWFYSRSFFYNSLHGMLFSSFMIDLFYPLHAIGEQFNIPVVFAVLGGVTVGLGIGCMLWFNTSVGGTDLLGLIFARHRNLNPGIIIFMIDFLIVSIGSMIISDGSIFLSCLTVTCVGITTSLVSAMKKEEQ